MCYKNGININLDTFDSWSSKTLNFSREKIVRIYLAGDNREIQTKS